MRKLSIHRNKSGITIPFQTTQEALVFHQFKEENNTMDSKRSARKYVKSISLSIILVYLIGLGLAKLIAMIDTSCVFLDDSLHPPVSIAVLAVCLLVNGSELVYFKLSGKTFVDRILKKSLKVSEHSEKIRKTL